MRITEERDPVEDLPDYPVDGHLPDGRPWPPKLGPQPMSALWQRLAETVARITADRKLARARPHH